DAVGDGVASARVGERAAVDPVASCWPCYLWFKGKPNDCTTLAVLCVQDAGRFSEYAVVWAQHASQIPEAVAAQYAVMIEPFNIAAKVTGPGQPPDTATVLVSGVARIALTVVT
ncbi:alcohol dehydrogenase catalytic domain-containing protein, partial [Escherichia coli]|nr:alcohol dehydrogenase catalytic domain-containing protein [Escherichia coli]